MTQIEHLNNTVPDIDETLMFLSIVAPDFKIRKDVDLPVAIVGFMLEMSKAISLFKSLT